MIGLGSDKSILHLMKYTTNPRYNAMVFYRNKVVWLGTYLGNFEVIFGQDNEYYESLYICARHCTNKHEASTNLKVLWSDNSEELMLRLSNYISRH